MNLKNIFIFLFMFLITNIGFAATVAILEQPTFPVESGKNYTIKWSVIPVQGESVISTSLKFKNSDGSYTEKTKITTVASQYSYSLTNDATIPTKQFYKIEAVTSKGTYYSLESYIILQAKVMINPISPKGNITTTTPIFEWEPIVGAAGYKLILSGSPISVDTDSNGDTNISGGNIIWQVSTTKTKLAYGESGDIGTDVGNPAPLTFDNSDGIKEYYYIIMPMFGTTEGSTSTSVPSTTDMTKFNLEGYSTISPTKLITPADTISTQEDYINFSWNAVEGANLYHIYIEELVDMQGINTRALVYNETTKDINLNIYAPGTFKSAKYYWYVITEGKDGGTSKSNEFSFKYDVPSKNVSGRILDKNNSPLERVEVYLVTTGGNKINIIPELTDANGNYTIENVLPGTYYIKAILEGYSQTTNPTIDVLTTSPETINTSNVILNAKNSNLSGTIKDKDNNNPLKGAIITAFDYNGNKYQGISDVNGYFNFKVDAGQWNIKYEYSGYDSQVVNNVNILPGTTFNSGNILLKANNVVLNGKVYTDSGDPIVNANVILYNDNNKLETKTLQDGSYTFSIQQGDWNLYSSKTGFVTSQEQTYNFLPGSNKTINLTLVGNASTITGKVLDNYNRGVINAHLIFEGSSIYETDTNNLGNYQISLKKGDYIVRITKNGYTQRENISQSVNYGEAINLNIMMDANSSGITGVINDSNGVPISGAKISISGNDVYSNSNGEYSLSLKDGTYNMSVSKAGYASVGKSITIGVGTTISGENFTLNANVVTITGKVLDIDTGSPLAGAIVSAANIETVTDNFGNYKLELLPGSYMITVNKNLYKSENFTMLLASGNNISGKNILIQKNIGYIEGHIYATNGIPIKSANVLIGGVKISTDDTGFYKLAIIPGTYSVVVTKSGYNSIQKDNIILGLGKTVIQDFSSLELQPLTIKGTIINSLGQVMPGIKVYTNKTTTYTDGSGKFSLGTLPGPTVIHTEKYGYADLNKSLTISENIVNLVLTVDDVRGTLSGRVNIPNAKISITKDGSNVITTNADNSGNFLVKLLAGNYTLTASKVGYTGKQIKDITVEEKKVKNIPTIINLETATGDINISSNEENVTVYITGPISKSMATNITGSNIKLPYGDYQITFIKTGYNSETKSIKIPDNTSIKGDLVQLGGDISGIITNGANAKLILTSGTDELWSGFADNFGAYNTPKLINGTYNLEVIKEGYKNSIGDITLLNANKTENRTLVKLEGKITLNFSSKLEANYILKKGSEVVRTGYFNSDVLNINRLDIGKYSVEIEPSKTNVKVLEITIPELTDTNKTQVANARVVKYDAKIISKIVSDGKVIANAVVKLKDGTKIISTQYTNIEGVATFVGLEENKEYSLEVIKYGYKIPGGAAITLKASNVDTTNVITLESTIANISLKTEPTATIKLFINGISKDMTSDENGNITISVPKDSNGVLQISKATYITKSLDVVIDSTGKLLNKSGTEITEILLNKEAYISGTITNGAYATIKTDKDISVLADATGKFKIKGLTVGEVINLNIMKFGYSSINISKTLSEGENAITGELNKLESTVTITVKDKLSTPFENAKVMLNGEEINTDSNGKAIFNNIPYNEGGTEYTLSIKTEIDKTDDIIVIKNNTFSKEYSIERKENRISGTITNGENASVNIFNENGIKVLTIKADEYGKYDTGKVLGKNTYTLSINKIGFKQQNKEIILNTNNEDIIQNLTLIPLKMRFEGNVVDKQTGTKLLNSEIKILDSLNNVIGIGYSDGNGYYNIIVDYIPGTYNLNIRKNGYSEKAISNLTIKDTVFEINSNISLSKSSDTVAPVIADETDVVKEYKKGDDIKFIAVITDNVKVKDPKIYYSINAEENKLLDLTQEVGTDKYSVTLNLSEAGTLSYQVEASDGANLTKTDAKNIEIVGKLSIVKIVPETPIIVKGNTINLVAKGYDDYGHSVTLSDVSWKKTSDNGVADLLGETTGTSISVKGNAIGKEIMEVNADGLIKDITVKVIEVVLDNAKLEMQLTSSQIKAGTTIGYSLILTPEGSAGFEVKPDDVTVDFKDIAIDKNSQKIKTKEGIVGKFNITATYKNKSISKEIEVYETSDSNGKTINNGRGVKLAIASDSLVNSEVINIIKAPVPSLPEGNLDIAGDVYLISPKFKILENDNSILTLPIPSNIDLREVGEDSLNIYRWNGIDWEEIDNGKTINSNSVSVNINKFGKYALMVLSEPLGIKNFEIYPNPFSPANGGTLIGYKFTSSEQSVVYATIKIYTENGELIKTLVDNEMRNKFTKYYEKWNGLDDEGNEVKNGRYILRLTVEDIAGELSENKVIILLK